MGDVEKIARRLSEAQRSALCYWPGGWHNVATLRALDRCGLASGSALTPLGFAVREYLEGVS